MMTEHHILLPHGLFNGSSGGVYVDKEGRAVCLHLESWNSSPSIDFDAKCTVIRIVE